MSDERRTILLVEDDEDDYLLTRKRLASCDGNPFELVRVSRLEAALDALRTRRMDVVLLDLNLPDARGAESLQHVRQQAPDVPIVVLTGLSDRSLGVRLVREGAQDYLPKGDANAELLVRTIGHAIERATAVKERKAAEKALRRYREHLEELVGRRTQQLTRTNEHLVGEIRERKAAEEKLQQAVERLEEHDRARSEFVSNVSHELKTPVSSMTYALENLLRGVVGTVSEEVRSYLVMISEDCQRLAKTINDILDLSRIEANTLVLNRVKLPLDPFVRHAVESLQLQAAAKTIQLTTTGSLARRFAEIDAEKMERVLFNVIQNAIKYTPEGGRIEVILRDDPSDPNMAMVDVVDNGIGIKAEHLRRVTERYFRVAERVSGTGLGLSVSREIVQLHGGRISISSPPPGQEQGTQVSACLPLSAPPRVLTIGRMARGLPEVGAMLSDDGYAVVKAGNSDEAVSAVEAARPELFVVDLQLPVAELVQTVAAIERACDARKLPFVALTDCDIDPARHEILRCFGMRLVRVPPERANLARQMEEALRAHPRG